MELEKPRNLREAARVESELRRKYPQMYKEGWGKPKKKAKKATVKPVRERQHDALKDALSGEEYRRLVGR